MAKATRKAVRMKRVVPDRMTDEILDAIEEQRQRQGLTLEGLAEASGSAYPYIQQLLRGRHIEKNRHSPTIDKLAPLLRSLGLRLKLVRDRS